MGKIIVGKCIEFKEKLCPDEPSVVRLIFFFGVLIFWYPTLVFSVLNKGEYYLFLSNLIIGWLYSMIGSAVAIIPGVVIFLIFLTIFNKKLSCLVHRALLCDCTSVIFFKILGCGIYRNSNGMHQLNGNYIMKFFAPLFSLEFFRAFVYSITKNDEYSMGATIDFISYVWIVDDYFNIHGGMY